MNAVVLMWSLVVIMAVEDALDRYWSWRLAKHWARRTTVLVPTLWARDIQKDGAA